MDTTNTFLDRYKEALGLTSDYQLAQELGLSRQQISNYRTGRSFLSKEAALKIAPAIKVSAAYALTVTLIEKAVKDDERRAWLAVAKIARGIFALLAALTFVTAPSPAQAAFDINGFTSGPKYTLHNFRRWLLALLAGATLAGCAGSPESYRIPDSAPAERPIVWVRVSEPELAAACPELYRAAVRAGQRLNACTSYETANTCTIYSRRDVTKEIIGDEFLHCFIGDYHP